MSAPHSTVAPRIWPPLDLGIIAAILERNGFEAQLCDLAARPQRPGKLRRMIESSSLVILSSGQYDRWQCPPLDLEPAARVSRIARELDRPPMLLGIGPRTLVEPARFAELIDYAIKGEPEGPLLALDPGHVHEPDQVPGIVPSAELQASRQVDYADLAELPAPRHDLFNGPYLDPVFAAGFTLLETSRGCPHGCSFCFQTMYGRKRRHRAPEQVAAELYEIMHLRFGSLIVADQDFTADRAHALAICQTMREHGGGIQWSCGAKAVEIDDELAREMARAGCKFVSVGIESGADRVHGLINTRIDTAAVENAVNLIKAHGMYSAGYVRFGHSGETDAEREESIEFARRIPLDFASFGPVVPYGPTPLGRSVKAEIHDAQRAGRIYRGLVLRAYLKFYLRIDARRLGLLAAIALSSLKLLVRIKSRPLRRALRAIV